MNAEALAVMRSMAARRSPSEMTDNEALIYRKLTAHGMAGEDTGREEDRRLHARRPAG